MIKEIVCIVCPVGCRLTWNDGEISGHNCERGRSYIIDEMTAPKRSVSSTVKISNSVHHRLPVKTSKPINKELVLQAIKQLDNVEVTPPISLGDVILSDVFETGVDFIATRSM